MIDEESFNDFVFEARFFTTLDMDSIHRSTSIILILLFLCIKGYGIDITSIASGNWESTSTWENGIVPGINDNVNIVHLVNLKTSSGLIEVNSITIANGGVLRIYETGKLHVIGNMAILTDPSGVASNTEINIEGSAEVAVDGAVTITRNLNTTTSVRVRLRMIGTSKLSLAEDLTYNFLDTNASGETQNELSIGELGILSYQPSLTIGGDLVVNMNTTGSDDFTAQIGSTSSIIVNGDLEVNLLNGNIDGSNVTLKFLEDSNTTIGGSCTFRNPNPVSNCGIRMELNGTAELTVIGSLSLDNISAASDEDMFINFYSSAKATIGSLSLSNTGSINGNLNFIQMQNDSRLDVLQSTNFTVTNVTPSLTTHQNVLSAEDNATLNLMGTVNLNVTNPQPTLIANQIRCQETADLLVANDISFVSAVANANRFSADGNATFTLNGNITNLTAGSFDFLGSCWFELGGTGQQVLPRPRTTTAAPEALFKNLRIRNSSGLTIPLNGAATVDLSLDLVQGVVETTATKLLTLAATATSTIGNTLSYITGPVAKKCSAVSFDVNFPIGKGNLWAPLTLSSITSATTTTLLTAEYTPSSHPITQVTGFDHVSGLEYWRLIKSGATSTPDIGAVQLFWNDACWSEINNASSDLLVATQTGIGTWSSLGSSITPGSVGCIEATPGKETGAVTGTLSLTLGSASTATHFLTFGAVLPNENPLPIILREFKGHVDEDNNVRLEWITDMQENAAEFIIQHSTDGLTFADVVRLKASETTSKKQQSAVHYSPVQGNNYYRITEVDVDHQLHIYQVIRVYVNNASQEEDFELYPNPAQCGNSVSIETKELIVVNVQVFDSSGKFISVPFHADQFNGQIQFELFERSLYTVIIRTPNRVYLKKVMVY